MMTSDGNECLCKVCNGARIVIDQIFGVLKIYGWILDSYVVDFFEHNSWSKLPLKWQQVLEKVPPAELGSWMLREPNSLRTVLPLPLLALRKVTEMLEIDRNHDARIVFRCRGNTFPEDEAENSKEKLCTSINPRENYEQFDNLFLKHVKVKKRYEVSKLAEILAGNSAKTNCKCIVDVGSGMGHLSRMMAFKHGLRVTRIEQDETLLERARKLDLELLATIRKHIPDCSAELPKHLAVKLDAFNVKEELLDNLAEGANGFGIIGLHPCGDLAATLLKFYDCDEAKFICIVGCCYMKLTTSDDSSSPKCYPLSRYVSSTKGHQISYNALEVACHAMEKHCDKLKTGNFEDLKVHAYRAALESLVVEKNVKNRHCQVRNVKVKGDMSFQQYCELATKNIDIESPLAESDFQNSRISELVARWKQVIVFGSLRLMLAPLVETVVLLDRFLYLSERNLKPSLKAEFDARISPRNFVLSCSK